MSTHPCLRDSRRFAVTVLTAVLVVWSVLVLAAGGNTSMGAEPTAKTVRLVVDFGDGVEVHFTSLAWRPGMTVLDALDAAKAHRRGVSFTSRGSGRSAMITAIGGAKNQGGGADSKNWIYYVNDKQAEVGAGARPLEAGDAVLWKYQVYDYNS